MNGCPKCSAPLSAQEGAKALGETASVYLDCARICLPCGIGLSNSSTSPTFLRSRWQDGLWRPETAERLAKIISRSLNSVSREKKLVRLANERSEDLLTWNVFSWLEDNARLPSLVEMLGGEPDAAPIQVFYWGSNDRYPLPFDPQELLQKTFGEKADRMSEPDVLLVGRRSLVIIEAKLDSPNDRQPGKSSIDKYIQVDPQVFGDREKVRNAGFYELTRYWALGNLLARRMERNFILANLVSGDRELSVESQFGDLLAKTGAFKRVTWEQCARKVCTALIPDLQRQTIYFSPAFPTLA